MASTGKKKKSAPLFPHHHPVHAQKLRQKWYEKERLKNRLWAARRRERILEKAQEHSLRSDDELDGEDDEEEWTGIITADDTRDSGVETTTTPTTKHERDHKPIISERLGHSVKKDRSQHKPTIRSRNTKDTNKATYSATAKWRNGQPNMRSRMNNLLEKIKQTH